MAYARKKKATQAPKPIGACYPKLTKELIHGFVSSLLIKNFDDPTATPDCHLEWWELCASDAPKVAIAAPRSHAKTSAITIGFVLASVLFRTNDYVLIVSDSSGQAAEFLRNIKDELADNEELKQLFKISGFLKDNEADVIVQCEDKHQFRISARGSEQKLRGLLWRKRRPNLVVCDDLEFDEVVLNDDRRQKFREWFFSALIPTMSRSGKIRVVGTILHMDSLLERLMPPVGGKEVVEEPLKSYWDRPEEHTWQSIRYRAHDDTFAHILWPDRYNPQWFNSVRADFLRQGMPEKYNQEYLNYPLDDATAYFHREDFQPISSPEEHMHYYVGGDLAISERKRAAFTVMAVAGVNYHGKLRIVDIRRFRGDAYDIINELFNLQAEYNPECFFIEQENIARALGAVLDKEMYERGEYLNLEPIRPTVDKIQRSRAFQARMRAGAVEWDMEADWFPACFNEMVTFPRGTYKDQVDALSLIGLGLNFVWESKRKEDLLEEQQRQFELEVLVDGQNAITGY